MRLSSAFAVICTLVIGCCASPINDIPLSAHLRATQNAENAEKVEIVKRGIYPQNTDAQLKQLPLQSLIGNIEENLFATAVSVGSLAHDDDVAFLPHVAPTQVQHKQTKRHTDSSVTEAVAEKTIEPLPEPKEIILQTTERVPAKDNQPAHLIIDRISVQPHHGGVPLIPYFEIKHTKHISTTIKDNGSENTTEISITKTASTSTSSGSPGLVDPQHSNADISTKAEVSSTVSSSTTTQAISKTSTEKANSSTEAASTTSTTTSTTTKTPKVKLEEAEKELKEKVAEIEADPVILSARI